MHRIVWFGIILFQKSDSSNDELKRLIAQQVAEGVADVLADIEKRMGELEKENRHMKHVITELRANSNCHDSMTSPESDSLFTAIGCFSDTLSLSCPTNQTITTTYAIYGKYADTCSDCCVPNPADDCTENVEAIRPGDWLGIQYYCDGENSCEYQYQGSLMHQCAQEYLADYLQIFYNCLPVDVNAPVAFTAYANRGSNVAYSSGDIVVYGEVVSNIGGHYNPDTSTFICPFDGVYVFEVTLAIYNNFDSYIAINQGNSTLVETWANGDSSYTRYPMSTAHVVTTCTSGESVWVESTSISNLNEINRYNHFSGFMIHNYEA